MKPKNVPKKRKNINVLNAIPESGIFVSCSSYNSSYHKKHSEFKSKYSWS